MGAPRPVSLSLHPLQITLIPLRRVRLFVSQQKKKVKETRPSSRYSSRRQEARSRSLLVHDTDVNAGPSSSLTDVDSRIHERTPLFGPQRQRQRQRQYKPNSIDDEDESLDDIETYNAYRARLNQEIDVVFGKWPGRLLNRHVSSANLLPTANLILSLCSGGGGK